MKFPYIILLHTHFNLFAGAWKVILSPQASVNYLSDKRNSATELMILQKHARLV